MRKHSQRERLHYGPRNGGKVEQTRRKKLTRPKLGKGLLKEICNKHLISHLNFRADARVQKFRARARKYKTEINQLRTKLQ